LYETSQQLKPQTSVASSFTFWEAATHYDVAPSYWATFRELLKSLGQCHFSRQREYLCRRDTVIPQACCLVARTSDYRRKSPTFLLFPILFERTLRPLVYSWACMPVRASFQPSKCQG
jgi:hypothetical protein